MNSYVAILHRHTYSQVEVLGSLTLFRYSNDFRELPELVFQCKTLELPWKGNQRRVSCIPTGMYKGKLRTTGKWANRSLHISSIVGHEVPGRSDILIHAGNYYTDILGCIVPGEDFTDINKDGVIDVTNSGATVAKLLELLSEVPDHEFTLHVIGEQPKVEHTPKVPRLSGYPLPVVGVQALTLPQRVHKVQVAPSALNLRDRPNGERIAVLEGGEIVQAYSNDGEWVEVAVTGWAHRDYLFALPAQNNG